MWRYASCAFERGFLKMKLVSFVAGLSLMGVAATAIVVADDGRGYTPTPRLHGKAYERMRDAAFARAHIEVWRQCHEGANQAVYNTDPCYILDHIVPLCAGGKNEPDNLQVQTYAMSLVKNELERETCRELRDGKITPAQARSRFHRSVP